MKFCIGIIQVNVTFKQAKFITERNVFVTVILSTFKAVVTRTENHFLITAGAEP